MIWISELEEILSPIEAGAHRDPAHDDPTHRDPTHTDPTQDDRVGAKDPRPTPPTNNPPKKYKKVTRKKSSTTATTTKYNSNNNNNNNDSNLEYSLAASVYGDARNGSTVVDDFLRRRRRPAGKAVLEQNSESDQVNDEGDDGVKGDGDDADAVDGGPGTALIDYTDESEEKYRALGKLQFSPLFF